MVHDGCMPTRAHLETTISYAAFRDFAGIFTSPVPLKYTRHTARFLGLWLLFMPFTLYGYFIPTNDSPALFGLSALDGVGGRLTAVLVGVGDRCVYVIANALISGFLFGIEELAVTLEEPFSILPMQRFCDNIKKSTEYLLDRALFLSNYAAHRENTLSEPSGTNGSDEEQSADLSLSSDRKLL